VIFVLEEELAEWWSAPRYSGASGVEVHGEIIFDPVVEIVGIDQISLY
jgi:hypothetical protein